MNPRGIGDRWLHGEQVPGVEFAHHQPVTMVLGAHDGEQGIVLLLMAVMPEPRYLVRLANGRGEIRVPQSGLRPAS